MLLQRHENVFSDSNSDDYQADNRQSFILTTISNKDGNYFCSPLTFLIKLKLKKILWNLILMLRRLKPQMQLNLTFLQIYTKISASKSSSSWVLLPIIIRAIKHHFIYICLFLSRVWYVQPCLPSYTPTVLLRCVRLHCQTCATSIFFPLFVSVLSLV